MKFEAVRHKDIRGNEKTYLVLTNEESNESPVIVNIGEKTYDAVQKLLKPKEAFNENQLTLPINPNDEE